MPSKEYDVVRYGVTQTINNLWRDLRIRLDGCYDTICDCKAMDVPIAIKDNASIYELIIKQFIKSAEMITDDETRIGRTLKGTKKLDEEIGTSARLKSDELYFKSFIRLYGNQLEDAQKNRYQEIFNLRLEKFNIAVAGHSKKYELKNSRRMTFLTAATLIAAMVTFIVTLYFKLD